MFTEVPRRRIGEEKNGCRRSAEVFPRGKGNIIAQWEGLKPLRCGVG
jgi:hypothetical protein